MNLCYVFYSAGLARTGSTRKKYKGAVLYLLTMGVFLIGWFYDIACMVIARMDAKSGKTTPKYIPAVVACVLAAVLLVAASSDVGRSNAKQDEPTRNATESVTSTEINPTDETQTPETKATEPSTTAAPETEPETEPETRQETPPETAQETQPETVPETQQETQPETEAPAVESSGTMVWIPESGKKYHSKSTCSGMENPTQVTLEQAIAWGYEPCKRCH